MKLEYQNGVRITKLHHEMTTLEVAIARYEELAKNHYAKENLVNTTLTEEERKKELKESLSFLKLERDKLDAISDVQAQIEELQDYRNNAKSISNTVLSKEKHHPTKVLEKYMLLEGAVKPSSKHTAHHIVPGKGKLKRVTARTRLHLHKNGIRINDPANGVYLVSIHKDTPHWSMPNSWGHKRYHTEDYERWISQKIRPLQNVDFIKTQLQIIGRILQDNEPKVAIPAMKK